MSEKCGRETIMEKRRLKSRGLEAGSAAMNCCRVEALLGVDDRGQMVLPKELRDRANIKAGDKLAIVSWEMEGQICCLALIKADHLAERVREFLGPVIQEGGGGA
jgi:antitoxin PrlF